MPINQFDWRFCFLAKLLWIILLKCVALWIMRPCSSLFPNENTNTIDDDILFRPFSEWGFHFYANGFLKPFFFFFQHVSSLYISDWSDCVMISLSSRFLRKREQILKYNSNNNNLTLDVICTETCLCVIPFYVLNWWKLFYDALKVNIYCL
jgi:hypothetical protein